MTDYTPFGAETAALAAAEAALAAGGDEAAAALATLTESYRRLLRDARRLVRISDRREAQLNQANKTLAAQQEELREARDAAQQADRAKSAFLAVMSHEIRTPMNGVLGMIELLETTGLDGEQRDMLRTVQDSARLLLHIINDILDFSKIEAGRMELETVPVELGTLVEDVAELLAATARSRDVHLTTFVDPKLPSRLLGDPVRLRQVLYNLAGNAMKFTSTGPDRQGAVHITAGPTMGGIALAVADNGIGISEEAQVRLFRPFTQAESGTARRYGGTGLGLAIVRRLVDLMGGEVQLDSRLGHGATFRVLLPLAAVEATAAALPLAGITVALLGDDLEAGRIVPAYLAADGADVSTSSHPDLLVLGPGQPAPAGSTTPILRLDRTRGGGAARVNATPLRRAALRQAVLVALGRAEPDATSAPARAYRPPPDAAAAAAAGQLVLVADDDATNRNVLRRQLGQLGYACETVPDGAAALAALDESRHGLLLTDLQMPALDGYELARQLRAAGRDLPIVACTADVTAEVGMRATVAGIDAVLLKPTSLDALRQTLSHWLRCDQAAPAPPHATPTGDAVLDAAALDELVGDDLETRREILAEFLASALPTAVEIVDADGPDAVARAAHRLKSSSAMVGAMALSALCRELEQAGKAGDAAAIAARLPDFQAALAAAEQAIRAV